VPTRIEALLLALFALTLVSGCLGPVADLYPARPGEPVRTVYLAGHGWHAGLIIARADIPDLAAKLRDAYDHPAERIARAARALEWVKRERTWERCVLAVEDVVKAAIEKRKPDLERKYQVAMPAPMQVMIPQMPAGQVFSININAPVHIVANNPQEFADALIGQAPQPVMLIEAVAERKDGDGQT